MKRRHFIQKSTAATALATIGGLGLQSFSSPKTKKSPYSILMMSIVILTHLDLKMAEMPIKVVLLGELLW